MNEDVQNFIDTVPADRRPLFDRLQGLILELYPKAKVVISYGVPTYKMPTGWVALGYWKEGVSLHTGGPDPIAPFKAEYPHIKTGVGSLNFRITDEIPMAAVEQVIRQAMERPKPA